MTIAAGTPIIDGYPEIIWTMQPWVRLKAAEPVLATSHICRGTVKLNTGSLATAHSIVRVTIKLDTGTNEKTRPLLTGRGLLFVIAQTYRDPLRDSGPTRCDQK
jgi:hypothetical protein